MNRLPPAISLMGPTASGKTDLAMYLCDKLPCEIISVDSALIYKGMDIGTAKPSTDERLAYPHHLIDIIDPAENYSVSQFREDALALMADINSRGKIPLLVGGTMMYFKVLLEGMSDLPDANPEIRAEIDSDAAKYGWPYVHQQLTAVDPESAARIHPNDPQRMQRALEVYRITKVTMTEWHRREQQNKPAFPYQLTQIALAPDDRSVLHQRIEKRFQQMLDLGFEEEVRRLYQRSDIHADLPSIRSVGYRQMWSYLTGEYDYAEMQYRGIVATRQLAKRQFTWLKSWQDLNWIYTNNRDNDDNSLVAKKTIMTHLGEKTLKVVNKDLNLAV